MEEGLNYLCSENNDTYYRTADLRLLFSHMQKTRFSHDAVQLKSDISINMLDISSNTLIIKWQCILALNNHK